MSSHCNLMKSKLALLSLYLFLPAIMIAQSTSNKQPTAKEQFSSLEVTTGYSMVLGDYGSSVEGSDKAGYAGNGWLAQLTFDWIGKHHFGLAIQYTFQQNPYKEEAKTVSPDEVHDSSYFLGPGKWSNNYLMIGPVFLTTIKKLQIDAKILVGVILASGRTFTTTNPSSKENNSNTATGLAYQLSAGVGYALSKNFILKVNLSYLGGYPSKKKQYGAQLIGYEQYKDPVSGIVILKPVYSAPAEYNIKKVVSALNPGIGLIYKF